MFSIVNKPSRFLLPLDLWAGKEVLSWTWPIICKTDTCITLRPRVCPVVWLKLKVGLEFLLSLSLRCLEPSCLVDQVPPESSDTESLWYFKWGLSQSTPVPTQGLSPGLGRNAQTPLHHLFRWISCCSSPACLEGAEAEILKPVPFLHHLRLSENESQRPGSRPGRVTFTCCGIQAHHLRKMRFREVIWKDAGNRHRLVWGLGEIIWDTGHFISATYRFTGVTRILPFDANHEPNPLLGLSHVLPV